MCDHSSEGPGGMEPIEEVEDEERCGPGDGTVMGAEALQLKSIQIAQEHTACLISAFPCLKPLGGFPQVLK